MVTYMIVRDNNTKAFLFLDCLKEKYWAMEGIIDLGRLSKKNIELKIGKGDNISTTSAQLIEERTTSPISLSDLLDFKSEYEQAA